MIYQLFANQLHAIRLFADNSLYHPLGLEPDVNPNIVANCPELVPARNRMQLVSYCGLLHIWRNPPINNPHDWVGFTSYRQLDKSPAVFRSNHQISELLKNYEVIGWLWLDFGGMTILDHAERCHPGIGAFMIRMFEDLDIEVPLQYTFAHAGFFAEYWIMKNVTFNEYMAWLYPFIRYGLSRLDSDSYLTSDPKALGYALERCFPLWCVKRRLYRYQ